MSQFQPNIKIGSVITNDDLCDIFGCSPQGGMRRSHKTNTLIIVSDHTKSLYDDRWINHILHYTGTGQEGDQSLDFQQNKTLFESNSIDISVHLFEVFTKNNYRYIGEVILTDQPYQEEQIDVKNNIRKVWVFPLKIESDEDIPPFNENEVLENLNKKSNRAKKMELEKLQLLASYAKKGTGTRKVVTKTYERSVYIAELVKRYANGICQLCGENAPFVEKNGNPYLESHHIEWLSRSGLDAIENCVALCPNCHRKMHIVDDPTDIKKLIQVVKNR